MRDKKAILLLAAALPEEADAPSESQPAARPDTPFLPLLDLLPQEQSASIMRNRRAGDRALRLLVRALLCLGLYQEEGREPADTLKRLHHGPNGRPELAGTDWSISFSHCQPYAVCAISHAPDTGAVGADVEAVRPIAPEDFKAVFSPEELSAVCSAPCPEKELIRRWTIKEALLKARGTGFLDDPVTVDTNSPRRGSGVASGFWRHVFLQQGYWLTVASLAPFFRICLRRPLAKEYLWKR